jgi:hypothetical protein
MFFLNYFLSTSFKQVHGVLFVQYVVLFTHTFYWLAAQKIDELEYFQPLEKPPHI